MESASVPGGEPAPVFVCPECGRSFGRSQSLGIHRRNMHGVVGKSPTSIRAQKDRDRKKAEAARGIPVERAKPVFAREVQGRESFAPKWRPKAAEAAYELPPQVPVMAKIGRAVESSWAAFQLIAEHVDEMADGSPLPDLIAFYEFEFDGLEFEVVVRDKRGG